MLVEWGVVDVMMNTLIDKQIARLADSGRLRWPTMATRSSAGLSVATWGSQSPLSDLNRRPSLYKIKKRLDLARLFLLNS
jgi:hypothetical protein